MQTLMRMPTVTAHHPAPASALMRLSKQRQLLLAGVTAALFWLSFFPVNWGFCAWFALVPLLVLVRAQTSLRVALLAAWLGGLLHYAVSLQWVRVADLMMYFAWVGLTFYCSLYFPLALWLLRRLDRVAPLTVTLPVVWTSLEYLRAHFLTGFAWYFLGHTQHDYLPMIQIADVAGVYAVTFLVAATNALLFELLCRWEPFRDWCRIPQRTSGRSALTLQAGYVALLLVVALSYGVWRVRQADFAEGPRVVILQSNLDQGTRNARNSVAGEGESASATMLLHMAKLTEVARMQHAGSDLLIWPETTCPYDWIEINAALPTADLPEEARELRADRHEMVAAIARESRTNVLIGMNGRQYFEGNRVERYNSALLVRRDGVALDRYDKTHCVPFGEFVPMRNMFPWLQVFTPYDHDYSLTQGERLTRFELPAASGTYRFGALICYEDSDPLLARRLARPDADGSPPVDFLLNITNDGWFDGTEEHEQHLAISRFRAIEARRALVRAVNMGISAVIDGNGRIVALPGSTWSESKKVAAAFSAAVPIDHRTSCYAQLGDWLPRACALLTGFGLLLSFGVAKPRGSAVLDNSRTQT